MVIPGELSLKLLSNVGRAVVSAMGGGAVITIVDVLAEIAETTWNDWKEERVDKRLVLRGLIVILQLAICNV